MAVDVTRQAVLDRLDNVIDPCSNGAGYQHSLLDMGMVDEIDIEGDAVTVHLHLTTPHCMMVPYFIDEVEREVGQLSGVATVSLETDNGLHWRPSMMDEDAHEERMRRIERGVKEKSG